MSRDAQRGRSWADSLSLVEVHEIMDAMVLGYYSWIDHFADRPSIEFRRAASRRIEERDQIE